MRPLLLDAGQRHAAARLHLAALDREIDRGGILVAHHHLEPGAEDHVHRVGVDVGAGADAGRAGEQFALEHVLDRLEAGGVPRHRHQVGEAGRAEPDELAGVEAHAAAVDHLMGRDAVDHAADDGAVLGGLREHEVRHQHVAAARHVAHHDGRIAGDVPRQKSRHHAAGEIDRAADAAAGDDGDGLALVEVGDGSVCACALAGASASASSARSEAVRRKHRSTGEFVRCHFRLILPGDLPRAAGLRASSIGSKRGCQQLRVACGRLRRRCGPSTRSSTASWRCRRTPWPRRRARASGRGPSGCRRP